ncbi:MAG: hypothetical protein AAF958_18365 [Planctomycetota bacterium]
MAESFPDPAPSADLAFVRWQPEAIDAVPTPRPRVNPELAQVIRLFWDDPPWAYVDAGVADDIAGQVAKLGVAISGMACEWSKEDGQSEFLSRSSAPRILPYRPERYGLTPDDWLRCNIIDVRLDRAIRGDGGFGYDANDLMRWNTEIDSDRAIALAMPPELVSVDDLPIKVRQLRAIAPPRCSVFASCGSAHDPTKFGDFKACDWDGWILRVDRDDILEGRWVQRLLLWRDALVDAKPSIRLWIVPPPLAAADMAKLFALGVDAVACDAYCDRLLWPTELGTRPTRDDTRQRLQRGLPARLTQILAWADRQPGNWFVDQIT